MKTKMIKPKRKSIRESVREKEEYIRNTFDDDNVFSISLQNQYYGSRDNYIKDRIHSCY